jgi:D-citramalate synthase
MRNEVEPTRRIAVMDTTLRDGEQTPNVSYSPAEKLQLARMLLCEVEVDRIEIASTRVSKGESEAAELIAKWARKARMVQRVEILGFCDGTVSVDWIAGVGGKVINLLTKGSERHCRAQLRQTPEQHRKNIEETIRYARRKRFVVNVYLEDWSNGVRESFDYVFAMVQLLRQLRIARIYLPDTLGIFGPDDVSRYFGLMTATWPGVDFEFHGHNDYNMATANCLSAVRAGARGVHTSVNGMGERAGNTSLAQLVAAIHDHTDQKTGVNESRLTSVSRLVETFSGKDIATNSPIVGRDVFTQTAGVHADGDAKGDLYATRLAPARFGRARRYALGKLAGKASLEHNLNTLGIELPDTDRALVLQRIIELGDRKHVVSPEDLPYIIADVLKTPEDQLVRVENYRVVVGSGQMPHAEVALAFRGQVEHAEGSGDGGYDSFMNALKKAAKLFQIEVPRLADYRVRIPPGGQTGALVETVITWRREIPGTRKHKRSFETFSTIGVDSDQLQAAVIATEKMLNAVVGTGRTSELTSKTRGEAKPAGRSKKRKAAGRTGPSKPATPSSPPEEVEGPTATKTAGSRAKAGGGSTS